MSQLAQPAGPRTAERPGPIALWGPVALYAGAIFFTSSLSAPPSPPEQLSDKHVHALVFGGLALVTLRALAAARWSSVTARAGLLAVALAALYGATDEWHQVYVPGRQPDVGDWLADLAGAALAIGLLLAAVWWRRQRVAD